MMRGFLLCLIKTLCKGNVLGILSPHKSSLCVLKQRFKATAVGNQVGNAGNRKVNTNGPRGRAIQTKAYLC